MIWGKKHSTVAVDSSEAWHDWFAWYPVRFDDGRWVWLHTVKRLIISSFCLDEWFQTIVYKEYFERENS